MSDFEQPPYAPLPPAPGHPTPPAAPVNPFGLPPAPPFQAASGTGSIGTGYSVAGYPLVRGGPSAKPPRPAVKGGSMLLIAGGVGLVIGSLLPWVTVAGQRFNGFADEPISLDGGSNGGPAMAFLAALLIGFGIAQLAARKVLAVAILPMLGVGGMQLYKAETPGPIKESKLTPRITQTAKYLWLLYAAITVLCILALKWAGMSWHDAVCHAFSAMALGGFSTRDASVSSFNSPLIEGVLMAFMMIAVLNFSTHFVALRQRSLRVYFHDPEVFAVWSLILGSALMLAGFLAVVQDGKAQSPEPLKAVLIFDMGGRGDGGFNDSAYSGMEKAVAELGVQAVYIEHKRNLDLDHAVNEAAASDAQVIIGVGFAFSGKFDHLAVRHPDKKFVVVDYSATSDERGNLIAPPPNLAGLTFKEEEGSCLVGAIAALKSQTRKIGFIGGMDSPIIRQF